MRDATIGLDYADQRYFAGTMGGRFLTADPSMPGYLEEPPSWNVYSYVLGDPINGNDPEGLDVKPIHIETGATYKTCLDSMKDLRHGYSDIIGFLNSNVGTLALQTWLEWSPKGVTPASEAVWQGIANVFRNRWHASESMKVLLGLKKKPTDKLDFKHMILKSSTASSSHWQEGSDERVWLKSADVDKLKSTLNGRTESGECQAMTRAFEISIDVYNHPRGDNSFDNTGGALVYGSVWWPSTPVGFAGITNLVNPFNAFFTPNLLMATPYQAYGLIKGTNYAVSFFFYGVVLQPW